MHILNRFATNLRAIIQDKDFSQREIHEGTALKQPFISRILQAGVPRLPVAQVSDIAHTLPIEKEITRLAALLSLDPKKDRRTLEVVAVLVWHGSWNNGKAKEQ